MTLPSWVLPAAEQLWSWIAVAVAVYLLGLTSKGVATRFGWRGKDEEHATLYDLTLPLQPVLAGALFGLIPLPTLHVIDGLAKDPDTMNMLIPSRMAWFSLAGAFCGQIYAAIKFAMTEGRSPLLLMLGKQDVPSSRASHSTTLVPVRARPEKADRADDGPAP